LEALSANPPEGLEDTVRGLHRSVITAFNREPRVLPAIFADLFSRSDGPAARAMQAYFPRLFDSLGGLLLPHVESGRVRPLPLPVLIQLLLGPLVTHLLLRPVIEPLWETDLPGVDEVCELFAEAYLRAVGTSN
jgi:hypothetical protein